MSDQLRGQEVPITITVDGEVMEGFDLVNNWTLTIDDEIKKSDHIGKKTRTYDYMASGYDFSFTADLRNNQPMDFVDLIRARDDGDLPHPDITITIFYNHRGASVVAPRAETYYNVFLKVDSVDASGREEFVTVSFSGSAGSRVVGSF